MGKEVKTMICNHCKKEIKAFIEGYYHLEKLDIRVCRKCKKKYYKDVGNYN